MQKHSVKSTNATSVRSQHSLIQEMTLRYEELKTQAETKIAEASFNPSWQNSENCDPEAGNCAPQYQSMPISGKPSFGRPMPGGYRNRFYLIFKFLKNRDHFLVIIFPVDSKTMLSKIRRFGRSADSEHMTPNTVNNWIGKQDFEVIGEYLQRLNLLAYQNNSFDPNVQQANKSPYVNNIGTRIVGGQAAKEHRNVDSYSIIRVLIC